MQCEAFSVQCSVCSMQCSVCSVQCRVCMVTYIFLSRDCEGLPGDRGGQLSKEM